MSAQKSVQKSVRLTKYVFDAVDGYRGVGFNEKLDNLVSDYLERRELLVRDYELLQAQINDKRDELRRVQNKLRATREIDVRLGPLVTALEALLDV